MKFNLWSSESSNFPYDFSHISCAIMNPVMSKITSSPPPFVCNLHVFFLLLTNFLQIKRLKRFRNLRRAFWRNSGDAYGSYVLPVIPNHVISLWTFEKSWKCFWVVSNDRFVNKLCMFLDVVCLWNAFSDIFYPSVGNNHSMQ